MTLARHLKSRVKLEGTQTTLGSWRSDHSVSRSSRYECWRARAVAARCTMRAPGRMRCEIITRCESGHGCGASPLDVCWPPQRYARQKKFNALSESFVLFRQAAAPLRLSVLCIAAALLRLLFRVGCDVSTSMMLPAATAATAVFRSTFLTRKLGRGYSGPLWHGRKPAVSGQH